MKAFTNGWVEVTQVNEPYNIIRKTDENPSDDNGQHLASIYLDMAEKMTTSLTQSGFSCTSYNIFTHLLSDIPVLQIIEYTNQELVIKGYPITNIIEFKQFLGTKWLRSRHRVSPELAFNKMRETAKYNGFTLMDRGRYNQIYQCIRGYPLKGRISELSDDITWMRRGVLLQNLAPLDRELFTK